jgi:hypothetical protein
MTKTNYDSAENISEQNQGLSPEDHALLNSQHDPNREELLRQKRIQYANNPKALEEIDRYDNNSAYAKKQNEALEAAKRGDWPRTEEILKWVEKHYPLTTKKNKK